MDDNKLLTRKQISLLTRINEIDPSEIYYTRKDYLMAIQQGEGVSLTKDGIIYNIGNFVSRGYIVPNGSHCSYLLTDLAYNALNDVNIKLKKHYINHVDDSVKGFITASVVTGAMEVDDIITSPTVDTKTKEDDDVDKSTYVVNEEDKNALILKMMAGALHDNMKFCENLQKELNLSNSADKTSVDLLKKRISEAFTEYFNLPIWSQPDNREAFLDKIHNIVDDVLS